MDSNRFRNIIKYSSSNRKRMEAQLQRFYSIAGMSSDRDMLNILQIARESFLKEGYLVLELPFSDEEIGALCYRGDALGYIVLNTSLPKVNVNFAICHEIYHVYFHEDEFWPKVEFSNDHYYEYEEESDANLFAGMLLMPETGFRLMYNKFKADSDGDEFSTLVRLMSYYEAPYMSVLIRCFELGLPQTNCISEELLNMSRDAIRRKFVELWLETSVLDPTEKDDYPHLEAMIGQVGQKYIEGAYLNERTLNKVLKNIRSLYAEIKGE